MKGRKIDPITVAVLDTRFSAITQQIAKTLEMTSRSALFAETRDYVAAIFTKDIRSIAQADYLAASAVALSVSMENISKSYEDDIYEGDLFIHNDCYAGNNHIPDVNIAKPVFYKDKLVFWSAVKGHQLDVGGKGAAGFNADSTHIWDEGLRVPACKLYEKGKLNRSVRDIILTNNNVPEVVWGDLMCMVGGVTIGERLLLDLVERYGLKTLYAAIDKIIAATEKYTRDKIRQIPDGVYYGQKSIDHDAINRNKPVTVKAKVIKERDEITVDLSDSDSQTAGFVNSTWANTFSTCHLALFYALQFEGKRNQGAITPIKVIAPLGSVTNAKFPAPVATCVTAMVGCIAEAIWLALAPVIPHLITAAPGKGPTCFSRGFNPRTKRRYANMDFLFATYGSGGTEGYDGWPLGGSATNFGSMRVPDPEICELTYPIYVIQHEQEIDSAGAGKFRGGTGHIYRVKQLADTDRAVTINEGKRDFSVPFGLFGGKNPKPCRLTRYLADGRVEEIDCFSNFDLKAGDILESHKAPAPGFGDPLERDIERVKEDVKNELVSINGAKEDYGVIINPVTLEVDIEATEKLRKERKK